MKEDKLTEKIMQKVASFEKRRTISWVTIFGTALGVAALAFGIFSAFVWENLNKSQALSLLTLFREDREVIAEFWQDTLATFWEELPLKETIVVAISLMAAIVLLVVISKRLPVIKKRLKGLEKYEKDVKN